MTSFYQWWILRTPVLLLVPISFLDSEVFFLLVSFLFLHLTLGLKSILNDYLHNKKTLLFILALVRLCNFEFLRWTLEFLF